MPPEAIAALRLVLYHRLKAWEASTAAEKLLNRDIDSASDTVDFFLAGFPDNPDKALELSEKELIEAFGLQPVE